MQEPGSMHLRESTGADYNSIWEICLIFNYHGQLPDGVSAVKIPIKTGSYQRALAILTTDQKRLFLTMACNAPPTRRSSISGEVSDMPTLSRWFVKSALICLVLGSLVAGLGFAGATLALPAGISSLRPLAWHLLTVGWATQLIFGVAFWMFPLGPKPPKARPNAQGARPADRRGDERIGWGAFALLNVGLVLRAIGEPAGALWPRMSLNLLLPVSAICQLAAIGIFVAFTWPCVQPLGR